MTSGDVVTGVAALARHKVTASARSRITVYDVLEYLAGGMSESDILADFPSLTSDDIRACLSFAAARERRLASSGLA